MAAEIWDVGPTGWCVNYDLVADSEEEYYELADGFKKSYGWGYDPQVTHCWLGEDGRWHGTARRARSCD